MSDISGDLLAFLRRINGRQIIGGCDQCLAYEVMVIAEEDATELDIKINVFHHKDCPTIAELEGG